MTDAEVLNALTDAQTLAATMVSEAGGDSSQGGSSVEERIAVGCVVRNRLRFPKRWGDTIKAVCLENNGHTWQFDCWRPGSGGNHDRLLALAYRLVTGQPAMDPLVTETLALADLVIQGVIIDRVAGATSYYAPKSMVPTGSVPFWAKDQTPVATVGGQLFFKNV